MANSGPPMSLVDWLDELCVRFIINLPREELESVERICFQIEEAQWFYEDFIRPLDATLPSLNLRKFCSLIFAHCPLLAQFSDYHAAAYDEFLAYKTRVPVRGAIMLNDTMDSAVLVKGWKKGAKWSFPRGKINKDEKDLDCAIREVDEETGFDVREAGLIPQDENVKYIEISLREQQMRLYVIRGVPMETHFEPKTRKEISKIQWYRIADLPAARKQQGVEEVFKESHFYMVAPFLGQLKRWINQQKKVDQEKASLHATEPLIVDESGFTDLEPVHEDFAAAAPEVATAGEMESVHFNTLLSKLKRPTEDPSQELLVPVSVGAPAKDTDKLAIELKKLLKLHSAADNDQSGGVAMGQLPPPPTLSSGAQVSPQASSLLALLRPSSSSLSQHPHTPLDQVEISPPQAHTPHHRHARQQSSTPKEMQPPPPFHYQQASMHPQQPPKHTFSFVNRQQLGYNQIPPGHHSAAQVVPQAMYPQHYGGPHPAQQQFHHHSAHQMPAQQYQPHPYHLQQPDARFMQSQVPPAANLPKLNPLAALRLNQLKQFNRTPEPVSAISVDPRSLELPSESLQSTPPRANSNGSQLTDINRHELGGHEAKTPTTYSMRKPPQHQKSSSQATITQASVTGAKPITAQQSKLLGLFQSNENGQKTTLTAEPIELAAQPSPHYTTVDKTLLNPTGRVPIKPTPVVPQSGLTTATVSGPLNIPDFEAIRRNHPPAELGNGITSSVTAGKQPVPRSVPQNETTEPKKHLQSSTGSLPGLGHSSTPPVPVHTIGSTILQAPRPYHPSGLLARQEQSTPAEQHRAPATQGLGHFDKRGAVGAEQKSALMSLFGKSSTVGIGGAANTANNTSSDTSGASSAAVFPSTGNVSAIQHQRQISQNGSPVSPLPERRVVQPTLQQNNLPPIPAVLPRRMSSFAEGSVKSTGSTGNQSPISPAQQKFLLSFLEDFASGKH